jgi:ParB-like chromosome segregation protein Spo0J
VLAFRLLQRETIPSIIRPSAEYLAEIQLIENIQREDLSPADLELAVKALVDRHGSQEKVAEILMKSKQWVNSVLAASRVRENLGHSLENQGVKDSIPSGHLRDIAALPAAEQTQATKEALADGGGKRAFRKAAQKAKAARGSPDSQTKQTLLLSFALTAVKQLDGKVDFKVEIKGEPCAEAKARFGAFCEDIKSIIHREEETEA